MIREQRLAVDRKAHKLWGAAPKPTHCRGERGQLDFHGALSSTAAGEDTPKGPLPPRV